MISEKVDKLMNFLSNHYQYLFNDGGSGGLCPLPQFDLYSRDYLEFAQQALNQGDKPGLINCVSNLKRAMDCELDTFFSTINLYNTFKEKNLKIEVKLKFIESLGLFSSRSLAKLNMIRNKMEHNYEVPKISEIDLYFELVEALIRSLQMASALLLWHTELIFLVYDTDGETEIGDFKIGYECGEKHPVISVSWKVREERENINVGISEYKEFAYYLRMHLLLYQKDSIGSQEYILSRIKEF
ncbi:hypothetical protein [Clostridium saccharoperbutylacetonicum]